MTEVKKIECVRCKNIHVESLFSGDDRLCVYCKADIHEQGPAAASPEHVDEPTVETSVEAKAKAELALRFLTRKRLLPFVERFNPDYHAGWVHKDICQRLEQFSRDVAEKKSPRLMLFMPPRHGKSTLASVSFPAWHLGRNPNHEFISCSYSGSLAMAFSRKVRGLLREDGYKAAFKSRLDPTSQSAEAWLTTDGGGYVAAGVGGGITGKGAHILLIDDPVKNREDAESQNNRDSNWDWYTSTAYTRLAPGGGVLVILTRWHDDDLAGRLLKQGEEGGDDWEVVRYPAVAEADEQFRKAGEALHPERYDLEALKRIERAVGPRDWSALYQQNPVADDGDYFTRDMIQYFDPEDVDTDRMKFYAAWDLAIGKNDRNDYTVGMVVGVDEWDQLFVCDVVRGRFDGFELVEQILDLYELWKPSIIGIEKGHIEMALGPFLEKRVRERGLYEAYFKDLKTGRRDKEARARAIQGRMQQGMVFLPRDEIFTGPLVAELLRFPNGVHDDQVDALAWLGLMMTEFATFHETVEHVPSWRDKLPGLLAPKRSKSAMSA
ncbi:MAG: phage terminase large subunit [Vibrio toranzoniae]|uniref:phage terminase large subunit n=1 Tax=Vibrio toranzoniae TaxID=1194427 RepID=UPI003C553E73